MDSEAAGLFSIFSIGVVLTLVAGFYCILTSANLIRALIGMEVLIKGATLLIIVAGKVAGRLALAQALAITMIIIEVAVIVVAVGIVLCVHKHSGSVDAKLLRNIKG
jgi:multisubunit Na+/H+ antiporter MnhC subunit